LLPTGAAPDGEVEDYAVAVQPVPAEAPCDSTSTGTNFWLTFPGNLAPNQRRILTCGFASSEILAQLAPWLSPE